MHNSYEFKKSCRNRKIQQQQQMQVFFYDYVSATNLSHLHVKSKIIQLQRRSMFPLDVDDFLMLSTVASYEDTS